MKTPKGTLQSQWKVIKALKAEIAKLKKENLLLRARVNRLEKDIKHAVGDLADIYQYDDDYY